MKKIYKAGDEIKLSQFTKKQATIIKNQIKKLNSDQIGLDHFSQKLMQDREFLLELIRQSAPVLRDYHYSVTHDTEIIKIAIDRRITGE